MSPILIYLLDIIGNVKFFLTTIAVIVLLGIIIGTLTVLTMETLDGWKDYVKKFKYFYYVFLLCTGLSILIPGPQTLGAMIVLPKVAQNEKLEPCTESSLHTLQRNTQIWFAGMGIKKSE